MTSTHDTDEMIKTLNNLISVCRDGERGFHAASEELLNEAELKSDCETWSQQRHDFAETLQHELDQLGIKPSVSSTIAGAFHRGWMNLRQAVSGQQTQSILAECCRGEEEALKQYDAVKLFALPPGTREIVEDQSREIHVVLDKVRSLMTSSQKESHHSQR